VEQPIENHIKKRSIKLGFSKFIGEDVEGCIYQATHYFSCHNTPPQHQLFLVSFHIKGKSIAWFN